MNDKVKDILAKLKKNNGADSVQLLGDTVGVEGIQRISTGCYPLDKAMGGGVPVGRIIEIFGPESSGKSTLCLEIIAQFQKQGKIVGYIDTEFSFDPMYAKALGVDLDSIILAQPNSGEEAFNIALDMVENGVELLIMDSVAAIVPLAQQEGSMEDQQMGAQARLIGKGLRKITGPVAKHNATFLLTNQLRSKIGVMFGSPDTTPGGRALPYFCSVRISLNGGSAGEKNADGERITKVVKATVVKNKTYPPFKTAEFSIKFGTGIDKIESLVQGAIDNGIFEKAGAWIKLYGESFCQGIESLKTKLVEMGVVDDIIQALNQIMLNNKTAQDVKDIVMKNIVLETKEKTTPKKSVKAKVEDSQQVISEQV